MKIFIKNIVSNRCKMMVISKLEKLDIQFLAVELGFVELVDNISTELLEKLDISLKKSGFEIIGDKKSILIEKIKNIIIELVHYSHKQLKINLSDYLSQKLGYDYTYLANIFSETQSTTIEQFFLNHRIERVKEFLVYNEQNINEIAREMHFSSAAHLSNQFKKMTGMTPSHYKHLKFKKRTSLENV